MRNYIHLDPAKSRPYRRGLYYECLKCGKIIPGDFKDNVHCDCRNIMIDADWGRIKIQDYSKARAFDEIPDAPGAVENTSK
jgi:hypothetical protein